MLLLFYSCSANNKVTNNIKQVIINKTDNNQIPNVTKKATSDQSENSINFQWKIRKMLSTNEASNSIFQIYLYDSITNENHYITTLHVNTYIIFSKDDDIFNKRNSVLSLSTLSLDKQSEQGCSIYVEDNVVNTYFYFIGNDIESTLSLKYSLKINKEYKMTTLPEEYIEIPKFQRELRVENPPLYGADVLYIQALLEDSFIVEQYKLFADGYYGTLTENEVRNIQKKYLLKQTGIVDQITWEKIEEM